MNIFRTKPNYIIILVLFVIIAAIIFYNMKRFQEGLETNSSAPLKNEIITVADSTKQQVEKVMPTINAAFGKDGTLTQDSIRNLRAYIKQYSPMIKPMVENIIKNNGPMVTNYLTEENLNRMVNDENIQNVQNTFQKQNVKLGLTKLIDVVTTVRDNLK